MPKFRLSEEEKKAALEKFKGLIGFIKHKGSASELIKKYSRGVENNL
jgi:hypothetical protein